MKLLITIAASLLVSHSALACKYGRVFGQPRLRAQPDPNSPVLLSAIPDGMFVEILSEDFGYARIRLSDLPDAPEGYVVLAFLDY